MSLLYRKLIYDSYITNIFGTIHNNKKIKYLIKYYKKNYKKFLPQNKDAKVLELACGMGEFYQFLCEEGYTDYTGVDLSEEEIQYIHQNVDKTAKIIKQDIISFLKQTKDNEYDVIIFNDCIEHLKKDEICEVLLEINRVLKEDAAVLIKTPNMANPFLSTAGRYIAFDHEIGFTEWSMREILRATKFRKIKIIGTNIYVILPIINQLAWLLSKLMNIILFLVSALYGRTSIRIYEKDLLAIAYKNEKL